MHTDKAIAEFEAWYRDRFPMAERMIQAGSGVWITHRDEMKECWLASRRELVIQLPAKPDADTFTRVQSAYWQGIDKAAGQAEAAGATVRG